MQPHSIQAALDFLVDRGECPPEGRDWVLQIIQEQNEQEKSCKNIWLYHALPWLKTDHPLGVQFWNHRNPLYLPHCQTTQFFDDWHNKLFRDNKVLPLYQTKLKERSQPGKKRKRALNQERKQVLQSLFRPGDIIEIKVDTYTCHQAFFQLTRVGLTLTGRFVNRTPFSSTNTSFTLRPDVTWGPNHPGFSDVKYFWKDWERDYQLWFYPFEYRDIEPLFQPFNLPPGIAFIILQFMGLLGSSVPRSANPLKQRRQPKAAKRLKC